MEQIKLFEDAVKRLETIKQISDGKAKDEAENDFYDSLSGWKYELFNKYYDAIQRENQFIDFNDCPSERDIPFLVDCLRECEAQHITISSGWSSMIKKMWVFCQCGCKIEGMIEINGKTKNWKTGNFDTYPAFLLKI